MDAIETRAALAAAQRAYDILLSSDGADVSGAMDVLSDALAAAGVPRRAEGMKTEMSPCPECDAGWGEACAPDCLLGYRGAPSAPAPGEYLAAAKATDGHLDALRSAPGEGDGMDPLLEAISGIMVAAATGDGLALAACRGRAREQIAALRARVDAAERERDREARHAEAARDHLRAMTASHERTLAERDAASREADALRARVAELEGERHRWRAEAERLRDRACWTPVLREQTKAAADTLIIEAGEAARAGRGEMATSIREARDVLVHGLGRLETERDELSARCARLAAVVRAEDAVRALRLTDDGETCDRTRIALSLARAALQPGDAGDGTAAE